MQAGREEILKQLQKDEELTNTQKWDCYSERFFDPNARSEETTGYVELTHPPEKPGDYDKALQIGRIVFDYVNGRVFYTPTHYHPTKALGETYESSAHNTCDWPLKEGGCANPFFEIVKE